MESIVHETASLGQHVPSSRSSSFSQSSNSSQSSQTLRKFHHHQEPTVLDRPLIIDAMRDAISRNSVSELAELTRNNGLTPSLRPLAWPLLLETHPFVLAAKENFTGPVSEEELPVKRMWGDIRRFRRHRRVDLQEDAIFEVIRSFLTKWGHKLHYDSAMVWIADYLISGDLPSSDGSFYGYLGGVRGPGHSIYTHSGSSSGCSSDGNSPVQSAFGSPVSPNIMSFSEDDEKNKAFPGVSSDVFADVFENVMLVMNHEAPEFSEFVATMRQLLPELSVHFSHEGILHGSAGGDDWLIWWMHWLGIRAFPSFLVARLWDDYFSFRGQENKQFYQQHLCTCILLMKEHRTKLLELDQSECRQYLSHMPQSKDTELLVAGARAMAASDAAKS